MDNSCAFPIKPTSKLKLPVSDTSTYDAMTDAIEHAAVVVPVLTSKYQESVNCRKGSLYDICNEHRLQKVLLVDIFKAVQSLNTKA